jgi:prepilin-type processing-associated H-X9-DG protein
MTADGILAYEPMRNHGGAGVNVLYGDGHVEWVTGEKAKWIIGELKAGHNPPRAVGTGN